MTKSFIPPVGFLVFVLFVVGMTHVVGIGVLYLMLAF